MKTLTTIVLLFLSVTFIGCGQSGVSVSGRITFEDGTPVPRGTVFFTDGKQQAEGTIDAEGKYTLQFGGKLGVPAGEYKVLVQAGFKPKDLVLPPDSDDSGVRPMIDAAFGETATTPLTCTVPGGNYDFSVKKSELYEKEK